METIGVYKMEYDLDRQCRLVREGGTGFQKDFQMDSAKAVYEILEPVFRASIQPEEFLYLICCDGTKRVKGLFIVSQGGSSQNVKGIFTRALLCNATNIIVACNHPSGDCEPRRKDIFFHERLKKISELMEIPLLDNVILGNGRYYSFKDDKATILIGGE